MAILSKYSYVLALNAGSATLKWALFTRPGLREVGRGAVERIGARGSTARWRLGSSVGRQQFACPTHLVALAHIIKVFKQRGINLAQVKQVGHRLVHGGSAFQTATTLTPRVMNQLKAYSSLAPLHNPVQLELARVAAKLLPQARQVAVFDTTWYRNLPDQARAYALPQALVKKYHLRRYGFHGLSHDYVSGEAARQLGRPLGRLNLITCHLGSGSSITAVQDGRPIDTSMGFTPLEGLVMDTRPGDLDPGLLMYLLTEQGVRPSALLKFLNHESGLKGVAGVADMREVLTRAGWKVPGFKPVGKVKPADRQRARLALNIFLYRLQKYLGAYAAVLGRVDAIVFTGGIGERSPLVRKLTMAGLPTLRRVRRLVIPTNEELIIARQAA